MILVSEMTGKLKGIAAINTSPLDNPFCEMMSGCAGCVCSECYSATMLRTSRKGCRPAWKNNGEELSRAPLAPSEIPNIYAAFCRFSAHGELINTTHAANLYAIARHNPQTTFALFTKRPELLPAEKPSNVILVYSTVKINGAPVLPRGFDKVFTVYEKSYASANAVKINCAGKSCFSCRLCYTHNDTKIINEILR